MDIAKYEKVKKIGAGGFGEVFLVKEKETEKIFAAKISLYTLNTKSLEDMINFTREVNINARIDHPIFLKFIGYSLKDFSNEFRPVIITEYCEKGSLFDMIELEKKAMAPLDWDESKKLLLIYGISLGMSFLHCNNVIHRDLKPSNILLDTDFYPKIADLGLSKKLHDTKNSFSYESLSEIKGTKRYLAPEIIKDKSYTKKSDVYAFGIMFYEIMTGLIPFSEIEEYLILGEIVKGRRPVFSVPISDTYRNLIERCWSQNPEDRPTFAQIVYELKNSSEFIESVENESHFADYVEMIEEYPIHYDTDKSIIKVEDYISEFESKLLNIKRFDLSGFELTTIIDQSHFLAQKGTEKIFIERFLPSENVSDDFFVERIQFMNNYNFKENVFCFKGISFNDIDNTNLKYPLIIQVYAEHGTLKDLMERSKRNPELLTDTKKMIILYGIARAMMKLQKDSIMHKNLIPENIILDKYDHPYLCCVENQNLMNEKLFEKVRPEFYCDESNANSYGMIMHYLFTGRKPNNNFFSISTFITYFEQIILSLFAKNLNDRLSFSDIIELFDAGVILPSILSNSTELQIYTKYVELFTKFANFDHNILPKTKKHYVSNIINHFRAYTCNDAFLQREIGKYYFNRNILNEEEGNKSFYFLRKAASQNDYEAIFYLAQSYENGIGCDINLNKANELLTLSAGYGFQESINYLKKKEIISSSNKNDLLSVVIIGPDYSGKSILAQRLANAYNMSRPKTTISAKYYATCCNNEAFYIIDTPSRNFTASFDYGSAFLFIIVFSVDNKQSFKEVENVFYELASYTETDKILLIGNKCDLKRQASLYEAEDKASLHKVNYKEVSCFTGQNIASLREIINQKFNEYISNTPDKSRMAHSIQPTDSKCDIF